MTSISRRTVLATGASAFAAAPFAHAGSAEALTLQPAGYGEVTLLEGPLQAQFAAHHKTLLTMDEDALLKPFREGAGLPAPGEDLGGWYNHSASFNAPADFHGFVPGHSFGQYVSGLSRACAITGDSATKAKVHRLVDAFAPTITSKFYDNYPLPGYTYDKISIGLLDAYAFAGKADALDLLNRATDAALPHLPEKALTRIEQEARPHPGPAWTWDETYTLPENLYLAYHRGAGDRFRTLAARYLLDKDYFDPLAAGQNVLPGRHAYSHMNALSSAMQAYLTDGSEKHFRAAKNGFEMIVAQSYATGGWGPNETYQVPGSGGLGDMLSATHAGFETPCGSYGHFKAVRYLMSVTGDSRYGDTMERVLYNTVLGALPMKPDGTAFYYSDYNMTGSKFYHEFKCTCCSGTLGQVVADYAINAFYTSARGVAVNLYVPSEFRWRRGITLRQTTRYPLSSEVTIEVRTPTVKQFSVFLRIPAWAGKGTMVAVNERRFATSPRPGRFFEVKRNWRNGDRITLSLDMPLTLEAVDAKHPNLLAVMQGPLALFAVGDRFLPFRRDELLKVRQVAANSTDWQVATVDGGQTFKPFFAIGAGEATRLYQPVPA